jgi:hypothetical protein
MIMIGLIITVVGVSVGITAPMPVSPRVSCSPPIIIVQQSAPMAVISAAERHRENPGCPRALPGRVETQGPIGVSRTLERGAAAYSGSLSSKLMA